MDNITTAPASAAARAAHPQVIGDAFMPTTMAMTGGYAVSAVSLRGRLVAPISGLFEGTAVPTVSSSKAWSPPS